MTGRVHGTAIAIGEWGVLLTGVSGTGKSDLALRLIDRGASLVSDDQVLVVPGDSGPIASAPDPRWAGQMEIRGLGITTVAHLTDAPLRLVVELGGEGERAPASWPLVDLAGYALPKLRLNAFHDSAAIKVERALQMVVDDNVVPTPIDKSLHAGQPASP